MSSTEEKSLFKNPSFLLMWSSVAASGFGDRMIMLSTLALLGGMASDIGGTAINAGVSFCFFVPYLLFTLIGGKLADKLPRKWIMFACDEARAAIFLLGFYLIPSDEAIPKVSDEQEFQVYALVSLVGIFAAIFLPTKNAAIPQIVPSKQLQSANALITGIAVIANLIGLVVGGQIIATEPETTHVILDTVKTTLWLGFAFYGISGCFFAFLKPAESKTAVALPRDQKRTKHSALKYVLTHKNSLIAILLISAVWSVAMIVYAAVLGLCKTFYQVDDLMTKFTIISGVLGAGMLLGAICVAIFNSRKESTNIALASLVITGINCLLLAVIPSYEFGLFFAFCVGFFGNITIINITTFLQVSSPNYIRARVMGLMGFTETVAIVITNYLIWQLPDSDYIIITILRVVAGLILVVTPIALVINLRKGPHPSRVTNAAWHLSRAFLFFYHRLQIKGQHNVPCKGPLIIAANHTTGIDPFIMQAPVLHTIRWVMLRTYQYRIANPLWKAINPIPVDQNGQDTQQLRDMIKALRAGDTVGIFPEGAAQRASREVIPFKPGIGLIAKKSKATIVPAWIDGTPQTKNMFWHFAMPSRSSIVYGKAYVPDPSQSNQEIADELQAKILGLKP